MCLFVFNVRSCSEHYYQGADIYFIIFMRNASDPTTPASNKQAAGNCPALGSLRGQMTFPTLLGKCLEEPG